MSTSIASIRSDPRLLRYLPKSSMSSPAEQPGILLRRDAGSAREERDHSDLIVGTSAGSLIGALYSHSAMSMSSANG